MTSSSYAVTLGGSSAGTATGSGAGGGCGGAGAANELEEVSDTALPLLRDCSSARSSSLEVAASSLDSMSDLRMIVIGKSLRTVSSRSLTSGALLTSRDHSSMMLREKCKCALYY